MLSAAIAIISGPASQELTALGALAMWSLVRTIEPIKVGRKVWKSAAPLGLEMVIASVIVLWTGGWDSSFTLALLPPMVIVGLIRGSVLGVTLGLVQGFVITFGMALGGSLTVSLLENGIRWTGILMLVGLLSGSALRLVRDANAQQQQDAQQMEQLYEANALLFDLQRIARRLPSSLDLAEVLRTTTSEVAATTGLTRVAVILFDQSTNRWNVAEALGASMPLAITESMLPSAARSALHARTVATAAPGSTGLMCTRPLVAGVYAALLARDQLVGLLLAEHDEPPYSDSDAQHFDVLDPEALLRVTRELSGPAAVAIENARWFGRIRSAAADDERVRIARDLHDRIGQQLAHIGFEVDRIARGVSDSATQGELTELRMHVKTAVVGVRETLYDLRTEVRADMSLAIVLKEFLERVEDRSGIVTTVDAEEALALPLRLSRELWHIAQEAILNAERHSSCTHLFVKWRCDDRSALLEVSDDGSGFGHGDGRSDSYGLRGLRERAATIGASLDLWTEPGRGTRLTVRLHEP
jgi:signal transduction histidine kinase